LIELLVVVAIIALLISILLPSLQAAREGAKQTVCGTNQHSIGTGMALYTTEQGAYPASYLYDPMTLTSTTQTPDVATNGYLHWSWFIFHLNQRNNQNLTTSPLDMGSAERSFQCPSLRSGGCPPTNPSLDNMDGGQSPETPGIVDRQARRTAYTANEALVPRNKFVIGFQGNTVRTYHYVKPDVVRRTSGTVLAAEFGENWRIVSGGANNNGELVCKSHRPIHGFRGISGTLDMETMSAFPIEPLLRVTSEEINPNPTPGAASNTRLDWVGRNHARKSRTNFLYADTHAELKKVEQTVAKRINGQVVGKGEWGEQFYSLQSGEVFAPGQGPNN
jgi:type II secretory pathway pseudopilin PulG